METRVFFVTDSREDNEELFETLEEAQAYKLSAMNSGTGRRIRICVVHSAYREPDINRWNYDDGWNAFETIKVLEEE